MSDFIADIRYEIVVMIGKKFHLLCSFQDGEVLILTFVDADFLNLNSLYSTYIYNCLIYIILLNTT